MPIRMATLNEIDTLVKARFDYFAAENWDVSHQQRKRIEASLREYYPEHLNIDFFAAFAEEGDVIASVAFLVVLAKPANLSFLTGKIGTVLNVFTYPEYRKRGYATRTMNTLIDEAKKQNVSYIELSASDSGKALYQKLGFVESVKRQQFTAMKLSF